MSAERVAAILQCQECGRVWLPSEPDRWRCYLDEEDNLCFYGPSARELKFDN